MTAFFDSTVLINFAQLKWYSHLTAAVGKDAHWVPTVMGEVRNLGPKYPGMFDQAKALLGAPYPKQANKQIKEESQLLRQKLMRDGMGRSKHGGEAETIAVINHLGGKLKKPVIFVTDDEDARLLAVDNGITTWSSWILVKMIWKQGLVNEWEPRHACAELRELGCPSPLEVGHPNPNNVRRWLYEA